MKVIDARSGQELTVGDVVRYPGGEWLRLDAVVPGLFSAKATITAKTEVAPGEFTLRTDTVPMVVRWMHPSFLFRQVAFVPS